MPRQPKSSRVWDLAPSDYLLNFFDTLWNSTPLFRVGCFSLSASSAPLGDGRGSRSVDRIERGAGILRAKQWQGERSAM